MVLCCWPIGCVAAGAHESPNSWCCTHDCCPRQCVPDLLQPETLVGVSLLMGVLLQSDWLSWIVLRNRFCTANRETMPLQCSGATLRSNPSSSAIGSSWNFCRTHQGASISTKCLGLQSGKLTSICHDVQQNHLPIIF